MNWIKEITTQNFDSSFNLQNVLKGSICYPASGTDFMTDVMLLRYSNSFVHFDYSVPMETVSNAMKNDFIASGYKLIGLKYIRENELTPNGFQMHNFPLKPSEKERIHFMNESMKTFTPFALWAVYELSDNQSITSDKPERFSVLHVGGEAAASLDALYLGKKINPHGVIIVSPGEGYGDNWTMFTNPEYRFYKLLEYNLNEHNSLPEYLITRKENQQAYWPNYYFHEQIHDLNIFRYKKS